MPKCSKCKKPMDHDIKLVAYYANGKPVYHSYCNSCMKDFYLKIGGIIND